jgi:hypothetical protein
VRRFTVVVGLSAILIALVPLEARAEPVTPGQATVNVSAVSNGPSVSNGSAGFNESGTQAQADTRTDQGLPGTLALLPGARGGSSLTFKPGGTIAGILACPPPNTAFAVFDQAGNFVGTICMASQAPQAGPLPTQLQLAQQASVQQPWPNLQVGINPGTGLTGLASWFWLAGSPQMPDATASAGPLTVTVHAALIDVVWDFGDGSGVSSGADLGRAFPAQSSIQHMYQTDTFGRPGGYSVTALARYMVTYSVNGGPFSELGVKARPYSFAYQVNQLQPEAVSVP